MKKSPLQAAIDLMGSADLEHFEEDHGISFADFAKRAMAEGLQARMEVPRSEEERKGTDSSRPEGQLVGHENPLLKPDEALAESVRRLSSGSAAE